jgi:hypothetical protein
MYTVVRIRWHSLLFWRISAIPIPISALKAHPGGGRAAAVGVRGWFYRQQAVEN